MEVTIPELVSEQKAKQHLQISDEQKHGMYVNIVFCTANIRSKVYACNDCNYAYTIHL